MLKINDDTNRLTRAEFEDYRLNSGITDLQAEIIRLRYHDAEQPTVIYISTRKYNRELNRALLQIFRYTSKK